MGDETIRQVCIFFSLTLHTRYKFNPFVFLETCQHRKVTLCRKLNAFSKLFTKEYQKLLGKSLRYCAKPQTLRMQKQRVIKNVLQRCLLNTVEIIEKYKKK